MVNIHCQQQSRELIAKKCQQAGVVFTVTDKGISITDPPQSILSYARGLITVEARQSR